VASKAIKISEELIQIARVESKIMYRSVGAQVEYWARLGREVESREALGPAGVRELMKGRGSVQNLTATDDGLYLDLLAKRLESLDGSDTRALDELRKGGHSVASTNKDGELVIKKRRPLANRSS